MDNGQCRKVRYPDRIKAELVLATIRHKDSARRPKQEVRSYRCGRCRGWHLTSWSDYAG